MHYPYETERQTRQNKDDEGLLSIHAPTFMSIAKSSQYEWLLTSARFFIFLLLFSSLAHLSTSLPMVLFAAFILTGAEYPTFSLDHRF